MPTGRAKAVPERGTRSLRSEEYRVRVERLLIGAPGTSSADSPPTVTRSARIDRRVCRHLRYRDACGFLMVLRNKSSSAGHDVRLGGSLFCRIQIALSGEPVNIPDTFSFLTLAWLDHFQARGASRHPRIGEGDNLSPTQPGSSQATRSGIGYHETAAVSPGTKVSRTFHFFPVWKGTCGAVTGTWGHQ
jgi:hypothetical protein